MRRLATRWLAVAAGLLCAWTAFRPAPASAVTFGAGSLTGNYGFEFNKFGTCPNMEAVVGVFSFDGAGNVSATFSQFDSDKGGTGPKAKTGQTATGTYTFDPSNNGTGILKFTSPETAKFAFAIDSTATSAQRLELINLTLGSWTCAESGYAILQ
jgi:hypothetical protein